MILLPFLLLSLGAVHASPLSSKSLPIYAQFNTGGSTGSFVERDQARAKYAASGGTGSPPLTAVDATSLFFTEVGVGTPPTDHLLLIDTGSSNLWIGANSTYTVTSSSVNTGNAVAVSYGSGAFGGEEWLDTVTLTSEWVVKQQSIGVASWTQGVEGFDGILGLGPVDLTQGTVNNTYQVPTISDNLYAQKKISQEVLGVFYAPSEEPNNNGLLTFGGYDSCVITSPVNYVALSKSTPASQFWGINQSISYGKTMIMPSTDGIVDSGTTLLYLPSDAFNQYQNLTGAILDSANTGLLVVTPAQYANLQTLYFHIGHTSYGLPPNGQIWPRALNSVIGGTANTIYLIAIDNGPVSTAQFNFINGLTFLQRFYGVFDKTNQRLGFAETIYTRSTTN